MVASKMFVAKVKLDGAYDECGRYWGAHFVGGNLYLVTRGGHETYVRAATAAQARKAALPALQIAAACGDHAG